MERDQNRGVIPGVVTSLADPDRLGRVRVRFPHLDDQQSYWARLVMPMAGPERGTFFRPDVGDEVMVVFEQGNGRRPYILGAVWSHEDNPPPDTGPAQENNIRVIHSRSGHVVRFDDKAGAERVEVVGKNGRHKIVIDVAGDKIQIACDTGDLELSAPAGKVQVDALSIEMTATSNMKLEASGTMTIQGAVVQIN